jgi:hypothetical protein
MLPLDSYESYPFKLASKVYTKKFLAVLCKLTQRTQKTKCPYYMYAAGTKFGLMNGTIFCAVRTGVQDVFTDQMRSSVVVYGYAHSADVLRKAKKVHKKAELHSVTTSSAPYSAYDAAQLPYSHRRDYASSYITPRGVSYPGGYSSTYEDSLRRDNYRPSYMDNNRHVYWPNHDYETSREYVRSAGNSYYRPSQDYPSRYDFDPNSVYYDSGMITNPNYFQPVRY